MISLLAAMLLSAGQTVFAEGSWASFGRGDSCVAVSRAQRVATNRVEQAQLGFSFDRGGPRHGQLAVRLSHPLRPSGTVLLTIGSQPFLLLAGNRLAWSRGPAQEAAIIAATRTADGMRVEGRTPGGGRFVDAYTLDGAPGAIDAAAACAAQR